MSKFRRNNLLLLIGSVILTITSFFYIRQGNYSLHYAPQNSRSLEPTTWFALGILFTIIGFYNVFLRKRK